VRSSGRKKTPTNPRETDSEDDPLDSYEIGDVAPEENKDLDSSTAAPDAQSRTKTQAAVPKAKAAARIKQEETPDDSAPIPPVTRARVGRSAKANTTASQMPDVTPAAKAAAPGKTRGRPKTPATAPANTGAASIAEEKENTVGSRSKLKSTEQVSEAEELPVKLRVSRTRAGSRTRNANAKAAVEEDDDQLPPTRQRATRVMRTRTKTG
jgi:hypothetical protein